MYRIKLSKYKNHPMIYFIPFLPSVEDFAIETRERLLFVSSTISKERKKERKKERNNK